MRFDLVLAARRLVFRGPGAAEGHCHKACGRAFRQPLLGAPGRVILERIPLVTSLFQAFKDVSRLFSGNVDQQLDQVVAVDIGSMRRVGFVMRKDAHLPGGFDAEDEPRVAVYLAMSYQLGGFTVHLPKSSVTPLDVPADKAMRAVLTGGSLQSDA